MGEGMCLLSKLLHRPDHFSGLQIMKSKKSEEDKTRKLNDIFDGRNTPAFNKDIGTEVRFRTDGWEDWLDPLHDDETEDGSDIEMGTPQDAASPAHPANSRDKVTIKAQRKTPRRANASIWMSRPSTAKSEGVISLLNSRAIGVWTFLLRSVEQMRKAGTLRLSCLARVLDLSPQVQ
jgi:hypothetical protein